ncbi:MAG: tRNA (adenosine(37)-N6)-threonylcarbamoyltransferase complex dimerization subunit type 1 TsaB [Candidatus Korobacteraceae bacterium]
MLILGIDTSGRQGSVALLQAPDEAQGGPVRTVELAPLSGGQYSELLVPAIAALLERHGLEKRSVGLLAVASGPGSFTGLRVAIATVKGLAEAFGIPVVPVSVLEAILLASAAESRSRRDRDRAVAAIDAQRGEVFFAELTAGHRREEIAGCEGFAAALAVGSPPAIVFTPDEALAARLRDAALEVELVARPSAEDIARIGYGKFLDGVRADVASLDANYVRRSDAELFSAPKLGIPPKS